MNTHLSKIARWIKLEKDDEHNKNVICNPVSRSIASYTVYGPPFYCIYCQIIYDTNTGFDYHTSICLYNPQHPTLHKNTLQRDYFNGNHQVNNCPTGRCSIKLGKNTNRSGQFCLRLLPCKIHNQ